MDVNTVVKAGVLCHTLAYMRKSGNYCENLQRSYIKITMLLTSAAGSETVIIVAIAAIIVLSNTNVVS